MRTQIKAEDDMKLQAKSLSILFNDTLSSRKTLRDHVLAKGKVVDLIVLVESLGSKSGSKVTIANIDSLTKEQAASASGEVNMSVTATGSWSSVVRTLTLAEALPYMSVIDSVRFDVSTGHDWNLNFKLRALVI